MFSLKDFIKRGLINAIGRLADYQIVLNAVGWYEKGVFDETDLADIQNAIDEYHKKYDPAPEPESESVEEPTVEDKSEDAGGE